MKDSLNSILEFNNRYLLSLKLPSSVDFNKNLIEFENKHFRFSSTKAIGRGSKE